MTGTFRLKVFFFFLLAFTAHDDDYDQSHREDSADDLYHALTHEM